MPIQDCRSHNREGCMLLFRSVCNVTIRSPLTAQHRGWHSLLAQIGQLSFCLYNIYITLFYHSRTQILHERYFLLQLLSHLLWLWISLVSEFLISLLWLSWSLFLIIIELHYWIIELVSFLLTLVHDILKSLVEQLRRGTVFSVQTAANLSHGARRHCQSVVKCTFGSLS